MSGGTMLPPRSTGSPSSRRAWIEIDFPALAGVLRVRSPSSRRAWIEMLSHRPEILLSESPSSRRAWIEI